VIWSKTEAGRAEVQARALVKERLQRNLLLLIDGAKTEEMLLAHVVGLKAEDFKYLESLNLIAPVSGASSSRSAAASAPSSAASSAEDRSNAPTEPMSLPPVDEPATDAAQLSATLTQLIANELGLRGFTLTLAVEKASTLEDLHGVAERVLEQIRERKGEAAANKARRSVYGA
jgi:hypothetical protein